MHVITFGIIGFCALLTDSAPVTGGCASGYYEQIGDLPGWTTVEGRGGGESVAPSCDGCADLCDSFSTCLSYECSSSALKCNLNAIADPSQYFENGYGDYAFCTKSDETTTMSPCDNAQCEDPFICDADADQFETVSDAQYPCKRDCDLFAVDEYLDQCSAIFPAAIETVTASIGDVVESVLQITSVDIPAVSERVMLNEDAVTTINTELGSVGSLIAALNDIDASTNSSVVAVMSLAERNEAAIGSLEEVVAFLESRVAGFGASDAAAAAKSADGQLDAGGELFGSTSQLPYKDALIGALVATNLIIMACFVYYAMTKRCNAKHKYVSVVDEESDREKLNI